MNTIPILDGAMDGSAGAKARALASAARAGLPVPRFVVLPAEVLQKICGPERDRELPMFQARLTDAVRQLCPDGQLVAVRSSAQEEDGAKHSFAGQLETALNVGPADLLDRILAVCASAFGERMLAYRQQHGLQDSQQPPAVIVQRMVRARASGVAFSADPVSGRRGIAVVSAIHGLGSALVSGETDADTWRIDRRGSIVERHVAHKRIHVSDPCEPAGVRSVALPENEALRPALTDAEACAVAELARRCARHFGRPQDIEWAYEDDQLLLLQARPITSLDSLPDPDGVLAVWDNSNIVESYSGITTPLTFSFAREVYEHVYRQFCRLMRVPESTLRSEDEAFRNMLGLVRGRLYYNLLNWYRVLALLPGFRLNRRFMEQMMGVAQPLPEEVAEEIARASRTSRTADALHLIRTAAGLAASHLTIERRIREFNERLNTALAPPDPPLADRRPDELAAHYRELRCRLLLSWDAPIVNDFFAMIFYGLLRTAVRKWCQDPGDALQNDLLGGEGGMVSAEPAIRIRGLAILAARHPVLVDRLVSGTAGEVRAEMDRAPQFRAGVESYLEKFGDRTVNELKLESATLHDDPLPLFRAIGALASRPAGHRGGSEQGDPAGDRLRAAARARVRAALRRHPVRRLLFEWILRHARARVRDRENLRLQRTRVFGRVRRIFVELGRRLHACGQLDDPGDIFYLEVDEILAFVDGRATTTSLRALAVLRRHEFRGFESLPAPADRFETRGVVYVGHDFLGSPGSEPLTGEERRGIGCSPGRVCGPVRIVTDPHAVDLRQPAILVAEHTDPGWITIFPSALGVLVERGSLLSHAAIVARELGIPAVVSIPGLTGWLRDGDWIELDGAIGVIRRVAAEEPHRVPAA